MVQSGQVCIAAWRDTEHVSAQKSLGCHAGLPFLRLRLDVQLRYVAMKNRRALHRG